MPADSSWSSRSSTTPTSMKDCVASSARRAWPRTSSGSPASIWSGAPKAWRWSTPGSGSATWRSRRPAPSRKPRCCCARGSPATCSATDPGSNRCPQPPPRNGSPTPPGGSTLPCRTGAASPTCSPNRPGGRRLTIPGRGTEPIADQTDPALPSTPPTRFSATYGCAPSCESWWRTSALAWRRSRPPTPVACWPKRSPCLTRWAWWRGWTEASWCYRCWADTAASPRISRARRACSEPVPRHFPSARAADGNASNDCEGRLHVTRFQPTRAGIINMWDYRDEEFCFAGGWLILRGPNGSGKTKALEVLFPFVLDGRIDPKRLNPFAAEDRTMKSNLLFRGGENAVGYVWLELRHRDTGQSVTLGVGLHAARHRDTPVRWHFVADGRVGTDFSLITGDDRPMTRQQLADEIGDSSLYASATDSRAAIDQRLFGLCRERYEQLLTLILTLRRPQLAKNLDPGKLSDTLSDGLRPVDDDLIAEAARSFDDMEAVTTTLEGLTAADEATRTFLASYATYLRTHARSAADALTRRREDSAQRRSGLGTDSAARASAETGQAQAQSRREETEDALAGLRARHDQLKSSSAYKAVEQLTDLERLVRSNEQTAAGATAELARRGAATARARADAGQAAASLADL